MRPDISVIIPVYNRGDLILPTIQSVRNSSAGLQVEIVVIDDGSTRPLSDDLENHGITVDQLIRQPNQGLLFARLTGLKAATGRFILFLDSDDLISPEKLRLHVEAMQGGDYDVTYTDHSSVKTDASGTPLEAPVPAPGFANANVAPNRFPQLGLPPHSPVFDASYLRNCLNTTAFPPRKQFNSVAEIWFYHHCFVHPTRAKHIPGPHAIVCHHQEGRITDHWEVLCLASLSVMEHFVTDPPSGPYQQESLAHVANSAFTSWRGHPYGMPAPIQNRFISVWKEASIPALSPPSPTLFRLLGSLIGTINLARILRRIRRPCYDSIRTMTDEDLDNLIAQYPSPQSTMHPER